MDYGTYQKIRAYCYQDLGQYLDTPINNETLDLSVFIHGPIAEIEHEHKFAMSFFQCRDLTPRENAAAHLLAVISNARMIAWQREPNPPDGNEPAPPLEQWQAEELARKTIKAMEQYAVYLPELEAAALLACTVAPKAKPEAPAAPAAPWKVIARQIGEDWMRQQERDTGTLPSTQAIGLHVADELSNRGITGARGTFLDSETIIRESLTGITGRKKGDNLRKTR